MLKIPKSRNFRRPYKVTSFTQCIDRRSTLADSSCIGTYQMVGICTALSDRAIAEVASLC